MKIFSSKRNIVLWTYFSFWFFYFLWLWSHAITIDQDGNVIAGHVNIWGDWAAHFTMGSAMAYRNLFLKTSPFVINAPFRYPFLTNFISAALVRVGIPFFASFTIPSFFLSLLFIYSLFSFYKVLFKSDRIAIISSCLFIFNGGTGFKEFFKDLLKSKDILNALLFPPRLYTNIEPQFIRWISVLDSMVLPQRAFLLGFPLALLALATLYKLIGPFGDVPSNQINRGKIILISIVIGLLPIIHTHSFLALFPILFFWILADIFLNPNTFLKSRISIWVTLIVSTLIISLPIIFFLVMGGQNKNFLKWYPGWYAYGGKINWFRFWFENWGITPIVAILGWKKKITLVPTRRQKFREVFTYFPFFILFAMLNLFLFQAFIWDNTKLLAWASVGISGLAGFYLDGLLNPPIENNL